MTESLIEKQFAALKAITPSALDGDISAKIEIKDECKIWRDIDKHSLPESNVDLKLKDGSILMSCKMMQSPFERNKFAPCWYPRENSGIFIHPELIAWWRPS